MNITELKEHDPKRFEREYWEWAKHEPGYDWWDGAYDMFVSKAAGEGVDVNPRSISYSQGDGAAFDGDVDLAAWMEKHGFAEKYPALYLDAQNYGASVSVTTYGRGFSMRANLDFTNGQCLPAGVFKDLPQEDWDELVEEQLGQEDWERLILDHCKSLAHGLYTYLKKEYEYLTSEEQFIERCMCNEVTFDQEED